MSRGFTGPACSFVPKAEVNHVASVQPFMVEPKQFLTVPGSGGVSSAANELEGRYALSWADNIQADMLAA